MSDDGDGVAVPAGQLRSIVERIERLEDEKKEVAEQIKEVYAEAKGNGFDAKVLRRIVALRKKKPEERSEEEAILEIYMSALGMLGTPLHDWAEAQGERPDAAVSASKAGRALRKAVEKLGQPMPLAAEDRAGGVAARFDRGDGVTMTISMPEAAQ